MPRDERKLAKADGLSKYFTGRACKRGHIAARRVQSGACVECDEQHRLRYIEKNPGASRAAHLKWVSLNPGAVSERVNRWRAEHPEAARAHSHKRRALEKGPGFSGADLKFLLKHQRGRCAHCREPVGSNFHVDHIIPLSRGGENSAKNIQLSCPNCNRRKQARDPLDFAREEGRLL